MARSIQEQLLTAYEAKKRTEKMTLDELLRLSGMTCGPDSLSRKLRGEQSLRSDEIELLATALSVVVVAGAA